MQHSTIITNLFVALALKQSHYLARRSLEFDLRKGRIKKKRFLPGTWRDVGAKPQSLVSVLNIPELKPKSLRMAYDVKVYV